MRECDLIMKGGVTSGVVYPKAIEEISKAYRLRSIGGTSAGAIAAAIAAAAEYRRQAEGGEGPHEAFADVGALGRELGGIMGSLFQPSPDMKPLFDFGMAMLALGKTVKNPALRVAIAAARVFALRALLILGAAAALAIVLAVAGAWGFALCAIIIGPLVFAGSVALTLKGLATTTLAANDFGVCPGVRQPGFDGPGFTDWIADRIDAIAKPDQPLGAALTVGELTAHKIEIATVTTDLSSKRPYQLPMKNNLHYFSKAEFDGLLPERVVSAMATPERRYPGDAADLPPSLPKDLYRLPAGDDFPVVLVARMSLSFPGLIRAVPLYREDYLLDGEEGAPPLPRAARLRRCLFSDGGISSNFPIHFFDAFLPSRPTFGISLTSYDAERHRGPDGREGPRVAMAAEGAALRHLPAVSPAGLGAFLMSILNTAKDWQDTLQTMLPGYAQRIVEVRLNDAEEGGMNLDMGPETIARLVGFGEEAGGLLVDRFAPDETGAERFDEHRWVRALSLAPALETALKQMSGAYGASPGGAGPEARTYRDVLTGYEPRSYRNSKTWRTGVLDRLIGGLAAMGGAAAAAPKPRTVAGGRLPAQDAMVRLIADADRTPDG